MLWTDTEPISWNTSTTYQTLQAGAATSFGPDSAHFFGGGMQNSHFAHKGNKIDIKKNFEWGPTGSGGGSVPFYISSAGFGAYRNTWAPGSYDFTSVPVVLGHNESRFDAYFFAGDFAEVLNGYTQLTGRPFLPPLYALGLVSEITLPFGGANRGAGVRGEERGARRGGGKGEEGGEGQTGRAATVFSQLRSNS